MSAERCIFLLAVRKQGRVCDVAYMGVRQTTTQCRDNAKTANTGIKRQNTAFGRRGGKTLSGW